MLMHLLPEYDPLKCCTWMCGGWKPGSWAPAAQLPPGCCIVELTVAPVTKAEDCIGQSLKQPGPGDIFSDRSFLFHLFSSANICQYQLGRTVIQHDFTLIQWHKRYDAICDIIQAYFATLTTSRYDPIWSDMIRYDPIIWTFGLSPFPHQGTCSAVWLVAFLAIGAACSAVDHLQTRSPRLPMVHHGSRALASGRDHEDGETDAT
jgi:putative NIF3 family GTP cyclohydrolase 1 type 2